MRSVGLKVLKNKLSEYVRIAAGGERVLVTDRDKVVAELCPPEPGRSAGVSDAALLEMIRAGLITPAMNASGPLPKRHPRKAWVEIQRDLDADRADRG